MNREKCVYKLVKYMKSKLEDKGFTRSQYSFDFSFSDTVCYMNHEPEFFEDGVDLEELKKICVLNDEEVRKVLNFAISNELLVEGYGSHCRQINSKKSSQEYLNIQLSSGADFWIENYEQSMFVNQLLRWLKKDFAGRVVVGLTVAISVAIFMHYFGFKN